MPVSHVAYLMRKHHVGDVVVIERQDHARIPIGILTDRDIVIETVARQVDIDILTAGDVMSAPLISVRHDGSFIESLRLMRQHKIRRLPVVDDTGELCGIITADDFFGLLSHELALLTAAIAAQPIAEGKLRPRPARRPAAFAYVI